MKKRIVAVLAIATLWSGQSMAQSVTAMSDTDLSKDAIRPEANHETWLLKTTLTFLFPD